MPSSFHLSNGQGEEFVITHPENAGPILIDSNDIAKKREIETNIAPYNKGFKNLIINPNKTINQRGTTGTALNTYYQDRWAGNGAGGLYQKIENLNVQLGGVYTLSWVGTVKCTVSESADNITYTTVASNIDSGATFNLTAGNYVKVDFNSTDFTNVQLEKGSVATVFEQRPQALELMLCMRYYEVLTVAATTRKWAGSVASGYEITRGTFLVAKRVSPTISVFDVVYTNCSGLAVGAGFYVFHATVISSAIGIYNVTFSFTADAEL